MIEPLRPAHVDFSDAAAPRSPDYDDVYHARGGAFAQARHVFIAGNGLPQRWARRTHFTILETGFGLGHNFLATWAAWRDDPQRCEHLWFLSLDKHPLSRADMRHAHAHGDEPALARELIEAWPPLTPDLHRLDFAHGRVHLLLAFGDIATWLPRWVAQVDAFYLDGFAPSKNPEMWQPRVLQRLGRLAASDATVATWSSARVVRNALAGADFAVTRSAGFDTKRDMLIGHHRPQHRTPPPAGQLYGGGVDAVTIVGAGLAGAATARALAGLGVRCRVFDALPAVAQAGSGMPAGLLHGVVHGADTPHTRWFRAAALHAQAAIAPLIVQGRVRGCLDGALRCEHALDHGSMNALVQRQGLPPEYVQALSATEAGARAGCTLARPAWCYPGGGWIEAQSLARAWLDSPSIELTLRSRVHRVATDARGGWRLLDARDSTLARSDQVVLAHAADAAQLLDGCDPWPLMRSRGQVTLLSAAAAVWRPALPVAGDGYAIALPDGRLLCGATNDLDDEEPALRDADHRRNLAALQRLSGQPCPAPPQLDGRVGWRLHTRDRLPLLGGVPLPAHARSGAPRQEQPRFVARHAGLYMLTALGSRGLTQAALAGETVAAMIAGTPLPIGGALLDAVDAARFAARAAR
ncbi:MAG TPA: FAD-dependent 5-carboxymethylaminomethyl-2-thiouridine(34) oxidoreductase MnmC [Burkholderiaceae bacterium]|nr:FAD-dependent 5-carboxymethylaminomethyl-2-thiouridine(34) oxidoreductase MnmC [Burkholderiaceae bacterium]